MDGNAQDGHQRTRGAPARGSPPRGKRRALGFAVLGLLAVGGGLLLGIFAARHPRPHVLPPPASRPVIFGTDVRPTLARRCVPCHGPKRQEGDLRLDTRELALKGGRSGPAMVAGLSAQSLLVQLAAGLDAERVMPPGDRMLSSKEIGLLRTWIDEGAPWPGGAIDLRETRRGTDR